MFSLHMLLPLHTKLSGVHAAVACGKFACLQHAAAPTGLALALTAQKPTVQQVQLMANDIDTTDDVPRG